MENNDDSDDTSIGSDESDDDPNVTSIGSNEGPINEDDVPAESYSNFLQAVLTSDAHSSLFS